MIFATLILAQALTAQPTAAPSSAWSGPNYTAWTVKDQEAADYFVPGIRRRLENELLDYPTTRFSDVTVRRVAGGIPVWCGTLNSKNAYGMYTGSRRFAVSLGLFVVESAEGTREVRAACNLDGAALSIHDQSAVLSYRP